MTLTEQWKKGELEQGYYYMQLPNGNVRIITDSLITNCDGFSILAPVPSYDVWQKLIDTNDTIFRQIKDINSENYELEKENKQLRKWCEEFNTLEVAKENQQLKELLKECGQKFFEAERNYGFDDSIVDICSPMIDKITNATGEK